mgnify:CR=1 FL=1
MKKYFITGIFICLFTSLFAQVDQSNFSEKYREFDFWIGKWEVNLRKQQEDNSWKDWKIAQTKVYPILDGRAILELWEEQTNNKPDSAIVGYSLRYWHPKNKEWILWLNWPGVNRSGSQRLTGNFRHGRGEFFVKRPVNDSTTSITRYTFSDITENSLRWDNATSLDGGKTWTGGWIMEFSRMDNYPERTTSEKIHTYREGERCTLEPFKKIEKFAGKWKGTVKIKNNKWKEEKIKIDAYKALGGCAVISFIEIGDDPDSSRKEFSLKTYNTYAQKYEDGILSNKKDSDYKPYFGDFKESTFSVNNYNRTDQSINERYEWILEKGQLKLIKWHYQNGEKIKIMEGTLSTT